MKLNALLKISIFIGDETVVPPKIHTLNDGFDLSNALVKLLVANKLSHRLHHSVTPVGWRLERLKDSNYLLFKGIRSRGGLRALTSKITRSATIIPICTLLIRVRSHFPIFFVFYVAGHIRYAFSAVDKITKQVDTMFRVKLVMHRFGMSYLLAAVKKLL